MSREEKQILEFLVALVSDFATHLGISQDEAYNYICKYKGLEYYFKHYNILHTLSFEENIEDLLQVCANNGGNLR